jgi:AcrR family transcriptional regulator
MKVRKRRYAMTMRAAKADATKARIKAGAIELYCQQPIEEFTLERVADRAETTVRTILRTFGSKEDLLFAALDELAKTGVSLRLTEPGDIPAAVSAIFDVYETMGDLVIQRLNDERRHPALKPLLEQGRDNHRNWVKTAFAPYLERQQGSARTQLLNALIAATDVYVWKLLRRDRDVSRPAAEAAVRRIISGVTQQEKADGTNSLAELVRRRQPAA